jgi:hypothetical protein
MKCDYKKLTQEGNMRRLEEEDFLYSVVYLLENSIVHGERKID